MTLDDQGLVADIIAIQDEMRTATDYEQSKTVYATKLMLAFKKYLTSGTVAITGTTPQGPFTGTGTIS